MEVFRDLRPDVVVIDPRLPGDGVGVIRAIRRECREARVVVLTASDGSEDVYRALHAGAHAYLLKRAAST